jgi:hypothetical protein
MTAIANARQSLAALGSQAEPRNQCNDPKAYLAGILPDD